MGRGLSYYKKGWNFLFREGINKSNFVLEGKIFKSFLFRSSSEGGIKEFTVS